MVGSLWNLLSITQGGGVVNRFGEIFFGAGGEGLRRGVPRRNAGSLRRGPGQARGQSTAGPAGPQAVRGGAAARRARAVHAARAGSGSGRTGRTAPQCWQFAAGPGQARGGSAGLQHLAGQGGGADGAGAVAHCALDQAGVAGVVGGAVDVRFHQRPQRGQQGFALVGHAARKADHFGEKQVDDVHHPAGQILQVQIHHALAGGVARSGGSEGQAAIHPGLGGQGVHGAFGVGVHGFPGHAQQAGGRGVHFQTAPAAAGAGHALRLHHDVAQLAGGAVEAGPEPAVQHDAAAHAGAQREDDRTLGAPGAAVQAFGQGGHVGVVADGHRQTCEGPQAVRRREVAPFQVVGIDHHAGVVIHGAGAAHAQGGHLVPGAICLGQQPVGQGGDVPAEFLGRAQPAGGGGRFGQHLAFGVHQGGLDVGSAQVNANILHGCSSF